jgi:hypothetical protein
VRTMSDQTMVIEVIFRMFMTNPWLGVTGRWFRQVLIQ